MFHAQVCHRPKGGASPDSAAPEVVLSILDGSELAQYVNEEGSNANVVYFVGRAAFSRPPLNFTAQDITVVNGEPTTLQQPFLGQFLLLLITTARDEMRSWVVAR